MSARRTALAVGMLVAAAAPTAARPTVPPGAAWLHYRLSYEHRAAPDPPTPAGTGLALAGVELDGLLGRRLAYLVGVDLAAGATIPAGFAYQVALRPVGLAVRLGATGAVGVSVGVGASGAVGTLDDGVEFPAVLAVELPLGDRLRLIGRGRVVWLAAAPARRRGAPEVGWADELDAWIGVRVGRRYDDFGIRSGNGTLLGIAYRGRAGARMVGVTLAYSVDLAPR